MLLLQDISHARSRKTLTTIWNENKDLQSNPRFSEAVQEGIKKIPEMIRIAFCIIAMLVMVAMLTVVVYAQHVANKDYKDEDDEDNEDDKTE